MNIINNKESEFFLKKGAEISGFSPFSYGVGVEILTDFGSCIQSLDSRRLIFFDFGSFYTYFPLCNKE